MKILSLMATVATVGLASTAFAQDAAEPALIFDMGGKFDKSFNEAAYMGAERYKEETGQSYREFEMQSEAQREQALRRFAQAGNNPIVVTGFSFAEPLSAIAPEFPDTNFVIIDAEVDQPNVRSVVFSEHEGSFLVGLLAAMKSESGKVGFVGGMDIPLIRKFACGYVEGVKYANPDAEIFQNMTGTTPAAWNDPVKGTELATSQIERGADVIYHAAGGTGRGVLQAANDAGVFGIGVDSNQNALYPGHVLTSMVKRVDVAVQEAFQDGADGGEFETGTVVLGLAENGVDYALDDNNTDLITEEMKAAAEEAREGIVSGEIEVHNYYDDDSCPVS
ncbi:BMP family lipoprotein [Paracoccaceae bacterium GXU_MW_L88]